jgi:hypothetical protein
MQAELLTQLVQLGHEALHTPQAGVLRAIGLAAAELIVQHYGALVR